MAFIFIQSYHSSPSHGNMCIEVKAFNQVQLFTQEYIYQFSIFTISNIERLNNKTFYRILLLLSKGLHLTHLNIQSILSKNDELQYIANSNDAAVIGVSKSKLDQFVLQLEIQINKYDLLRNIRSDISYIQKHYFPKEIENVYFEILLPKTKPIVVGII